MALTEELPIYKATYDLVLIIFGFVKNFNKEYKYTIGESIKKEAVKAVTNIFRIKREKYFKTHYGKMYLKKRLAK